MIAPDNLVAADVDNYRLIQPLTPNRTFLCSDASSNVVVLVRLETDCLYRSGLHPSIRDRLARVRELPHPRVATLRGVERWDDIACMVWVYLDGDNWDDFLRQDPETFPAIASGLAASLFALHDLGIVHGNLHGRNVIIRPDRQVWLTQLSPYLYTDPAVDIAALAQLFEACRAHLKTSAQTRLDRLLLQLDRDKLELQELSQELLKLGDAEPDDEPAEPAVNEAGYRRSSLAGAFAITVIAISLAIGIHYHFSKRPRPDPMPSQPLRGNLRSALQTARQT